MDTSDAVQYSGALPNQLNPLFTCQQVVCAYPISDLYASTPRYLYYALIVASILVRSRSWLANVFLGTAAAYAGTAAIEAFILISNQQHIQPDQTVSVPFINSNDVPGNATYAALPNLVTDSTSVDVSPAVMELDIDAILAVVVTGYLVMLPMHCWSNTVRSYRARHLLIGLWNVLMLAGSICALVLWPTLDWNEFPTQWRFCYPQYPDDSSTSNDGWVDSFWKGNWNSTIWDVFGNLTASFELTDNCLYPCFNTTSVLRQPSSITASLNVNSSPRTSYFSGNTNYAHFDELTAFMYAAIGVTTCTALLLVLLNTTRLKRITRIPVHKPQLLWFARKEIWHAVSGDIKSGLWIKQSAPSTRKPREQRIDRLKACTRVLIDLIALLVLIVATVFVPVTNIAFIIWIEYFIHRDINSKETPKQVGQWSSLAAIGLVLVSAAVLRTRYYIATQEEIQNDMERYRSKLIHLQAIMDHKIERQQAKQRRDSVEMTATTSP